jgi:hypothetical protein
MVERDISLFMERSMIRKATHGENPYFP